MTGLISGLYLINNGLRFFHHCHLFVNQVIDSSLAALEFLASIPVQLSLFSRLFGDCIVVSPVFRKCVGLNALDISLFGLPAAVHEMVRPLCVVRAPTDGRGHSAHYGPLLVAKFS